MRDRSGADGSGTRAHTPQNEETVSRMAGQADRSSSGSTGPTARRQPANRSRRNSAPVPGNAVPIPIAPESQASPAASQAVAVAQDAALGPELIHREVVTAQALRFLDSKGIAPAEAAGLIAYVVGLGSCKSRWSLPQVNRLLFLRSLYRDSDWGRTEREPVEL